MGARESSAGDEFHLLWAARRAAALLTPSSTLSRLFVEKLADEDDPDGDDRLLTADVVEYHGGGDLKTADRIDIVQLKYSTRSPRRAWTAARLAEGSSGGRRNTSLIKRLSDAANYAVERLGSDGALARFRVRLVSNQPADETLVRAVSAAAATGNATMAAILKKIEGENAAIVRALYAASGQKSQVFAVFLRCLDLSGCGEVPRVALQGRLGRDLAPHAPANPMRAAGMLVDLVRSEALPEGVGSLGIDQERVLAALGAASTETLFPAPPRFDRIDRPIVTGDVRRVAEAVTGALTRQAVVHGDAGVGKTTTCLLIDQHLPEGSVLVPFDCFGGGDYLNAGAQRHTVRRALRQLVNELAIRCGTPFLVVDEMELPDLERHFVRVLEQAAETVSERGGLLVLLIDAADNAAFAGRTEGDCVVPRLWATEMPAGARLVMSARTHRLGLIEPPEGAADVLLTGFDEQASAEHLRREHAGASAQEAHLFHERTQGNPRVQRYVLDGGDGLDDVLASSEKTPTDLFEVIYQAAVAQAEDPERALDHAAALLATVRPGGVRVFADVEGLRRHRAVAFCRGLVPGIRIEGEDDDVRVEFKDEDFERFLVARVGRERLREAHSRYATLCLARESEDPYAARAIADHLAAAGRSEELVALVLRDGTPTVIRDDVARLEIRQRRARLALRAATSPEDGTRVVLLLAEMARERGGFAGVVHQAPGLAVRYADPGAVGRLFLREDRDRQWLGPAHFHAAAVLSADPDAGPVARRHLLAGRAWVQEWMREGRDLGWRIETADIVHEVVGALRLESAEEAVAQAARWRPRTLRLDVAYGVGRAVGAPGGGVPDAPWDRVGALMGMAVVAGGWASGAELDGEVVVRAGEALRRANRNGRRREEWSGNWAVDAAEALAQSGSSAPLVRSVLDAFGPAVDRHYGLYGGRGAVHLRQAALLAALDGRDVVLTDVLPASLRDLAEVRGTGPNGAWPKIESEDDKEKEVEGQRRKDVDEWHRRVGPLLAVAALRARALVGDVDADSVREGLVSALGAWARRDQAYSRQYDDRWVDWLTMAVDAAGLAGAGPEALRWLDEKVRDSAAVEPGAAWLSMAERATRYGLFRGAVLDWVGLAVRWRLDHNAPVVERRDLLLRAAQVALPLDEPYGRDLYLQALEAASELDDQGAILLASHARLVESTAGAFGQGEARALAVRLPESVDALAPRVSESRELPYVETVRAALALSLERGLEAWARWGDSGAMDMGAPMPGAARVVAACGLEPEEEVALLRATDAFTVAAATAALDRLGPGERRRRLFRRLTDTVLREEPLNARAAMARGLAAWAERSEFQTDRDRLQAVAEFAETLTPPRPQNYEGGETSRAVREVDAKEAARVEAAVQAAMADVVAGEFGSLGERWSEATQGMERITTSEFVGRVAGSVRPSDRVRFLTALASGTATEGLQRFQAEETVSAVRAQIAAWRDSRAVREAEADLGARLVADHLPGLMGYWGEPQRAMDEVLAMLPEKERAGAILGAVLIHIPDLSVYDLYGTFEVLARLLPNDARGRVLAESLSRRERATREGGELTGQDGTPEPPPEAALAQFVWSLLGDRDRRDRWRALHAAYGMLADLPEDRARRVLGHLLDHLDVPGGGGLRHEGRLFLWHSARVSALQLVLRLAHGAPGVVAPFVGRLAGVAEDRVRPHVVARELARRAVLRLTETGQVTLADEALSRLRATNQPRACRTGKHDRQRWGPYHGGWRVDRDDDPFGFDTMDTVPYWYEPLEERLAVEPGTVLARAKVWVIERWGLDRSTWWDEVHERDYHGDTRVYKGSVPAVESARPYAEWHAMMCVAGELIDEGVEVVQTEYGDDAEDPWAAWLDEHLPFRDDVWASELLSETPLEPDLWGRLDPLDEWLDAAEPGAFDAALGLREGWQDRPLPDWLPVRGYVSVRSGDRNGDVTIASALVTPDTADALVRALLDEDSQRWVLPDLDPEETEHDTTDGIREPRYELTGWMAWTPREREGLDEHDPLRRGAGLSFGSPGARVSAALGLTGGPHEWADDQGRPAFTFTRWSDAPPDPDRASSPYTAGYRMRASLPPLLDALRELGRELLFEVRLQRNTSYERRRHDDAPERPHDPGRSRLYLLRRDGTLVGCEPEAGAWARDRPRAQW